MKPKPPKYSEKIPILHEKPNFYREHKKNEVSESLIAFIFLNRQGIIIIKQQSIIILTLVKLSLSYFVISVWFWLSTDISFYN